MTAATAAPSLPADASPRAAALDYAAPGAVIQAHEFAYRRSADQDATRPARHRVVVVGAGPVGLTLEIDLAQRGVPVVLLDNDCRLSTGSRAICFAKRTLEIWDRLGVGEAMCAKGVQWHVGRVFFGAEQLYQFDLLPEAGHERPAFINLQQYYAEAFLALRAGELSPLDLRWKNSVAAIDNLPGGGVRLGVDTPEGRYVLEADYVVACDGSRSSLRGLLGLESKGRVFRDRFLIADVRMQVDFPAERWFWFDPPFHPNQSVLLHRQPDGVWRIDFQLGWDADPEAERQPERIRPRVDAMMRQALGRTVPYELEWASVYTFSCLRMDSFRHGRVFFAGDAAHGVSPFGARGANSGVQDADNLAWKLAAVVQGRAGDALLATYGPEREFAADENLRHSTRATDFITPKSEISRLFRDAVLDLSRTQPFARTLVNSGRLSTPAVLPAGGLQTPDVEAFTGRMAPGAPAADAPVGLPDGTRGWLLRQAGLDFTLLVGADAESARALARATEDDAQAGPVTRVLRLFSPGARAGAGLVDIDGAVRERYDLQPGDAILLRPDGHVCARWRRPDLPAVRAAIRRAFALA
jgi:3-(3-hydroxy-phenyl)propionate hydroxylase